MTEQVDKGDASLVSIIVRSLGRDTLRQAVESVQGQEHSNLELVLVEASGAESTIGEADCAPVNLVKVNTGQLLSRTEAANAGLTAATGEFLLFLDEDDWLAPDHVSGLLGILHDNDTVRAAYSSTRKTSESGEPLDILFDQEYDPVLLMRDNYIPIHAMLFHRSLLDQGCRFDEDLPIYEDWDFWLQVNQHTDFLHLDQISAFYREGGGSATAAADARLRYDNDSELGRARIKLFNKWLPSFSGARFNQLLGSLDQSELIAELSLQISDLSTKVETEHQANLAHQAQIRQLLAELESITDLLNNERIRSQDAQAAVNGLRSDKTQLEASISTLETAIEEVRGQLAHTESELANKRHEIEALDGVLNARNRHIESLDAQLEEVFNSTSWKLTRPFRAARRAIGRVGGGSNTNE